MLTAKETDQLDLWALRLTLGVTGIAFVSVPPTNHDALSTDTQRSEGSGYPVDALGEDVWNIAPLWGHWMLREDASRERSQIPWRITWAMSSELFFFLFSGFTFTPKTDVGNKNVDVAISRFEIKPFTFPNCRPLSHLRQRVGGIWDITKDPSLRHKNTKYTGRLLKRQPFHKLCLKNTALYRGKWRNG